MKNLNELCYLKVIQLVESGIIKITEEMDILDFTELLIKIENEKNEKQDLSDKNIEYNDEIISIEDMGILETIDISVTGDNLFYCNGILTKNSFGLPATADLMFALINSEELEELGQMMVKQLKNRYSDPTHFKRFTIGVDRSKMRLYDVEQSAQTGIADAGHQGLGAHNKIKQEKKSFDGFKI